MRAKVKRKVARLGCNFFLFVRKRRNGATCKSQRLPGLLKRVDWGCRARRARSCQKRPAFATQRILYFKQGGFRDRLSILVWAAARIQRLIQSGGQTIRRPTRPRQTRHGPATTRPLERRGPCLLGLPRSWQAGRQGHSSSRRSRRDAVSMTASARWRERWELLNIVDQDLCPVRRRRGVVLRTASARWRGDFAHTSLFGTARPAGRRRTEGRRAPGRT